jgi:hypothetical protein
MARAFASIIAFAVLSGCSPMDTHLEAGTYQGYGDPAASQGGQLANPYVRGLTLSLAADRTHATLSTPDGRSQELQLEASPRAYECPGNGGGGRSSERLAIAGGPLTVEGDTAQQPILSSACSSGIRVVLFDNVDPGRRRIVQKFESARPTAEIDWGDDGAAAPLGDRDQFLREVGAIP